MITNIGIYIYRIIERNSLKWLSIIFLLLAGMNQASAKGDIASKTHHQAIDRGTGHKLHSHASILKNT